MTKRVKSAKDIAFDKEKDKAEIQERLKTSLGILSMLGGGFQ